MGTPEESGTVDSTAVVVALALLAFGFVNVLRLVFWAARPLWGLVIVPPITFFAVFGWIAFKNRPEPEETA